MTDITPTDATATAADPTGAPEVTLFTPELGQYLYGTPNQEYEAPEYVIALLIAILEDYTRVYWNVTQTSCDILGGSFTTDTSEAAALGIDGLQIRSYWWGDEEDSRADLPNFAYGDVAVTWYKHVGRGTAVNVAWEPAAWVSWFDGALAAIRAADARHY